MGHRGSTLHLVLSTGSTTVSPAFSTLSTDFAAILQSHDKRLCDLWGNSRKVGIKRETIGALTLVKGVGILDGLCARTAGGGSEEQ